MSTEPSGAEWRPPPASPPVAHLRRLTTALGIWQHAHGIEPDRQFGYCLDDAARAWIVCLRWAALGLPGAPDPAPYRDFLARAQRSDGRVHNFAAEDGLWLDRWGSRDAHGRAAWAWGVAASLGEAEAAQRLSRVLPHLVDTGWNHSRAYAILGVSAWLAADVAAPHGADGLRRLAEPLVAQYDTFSRPGWRWFGARVTYAGARLPQALALAATALGERSWMERAREALSWYLDAARRPPIHPQGAGPVLWPVGQDGWWERGGRPAEWDQQPVEAGSIVEAALTMDELGASEESWQEVAGWAWGWYEGQNALGVRLLDDASGGCRDGLHREGASENEGAESLLVALMAHLALHG